MQIFNSISEIETINKHLEQAQKQLQSINKTKSPFVEEKNIQPVFVDRIRELEIEIHDKIQAIEGVTLMTQSDCLVPENIDVAELVGKELQVMPGWFAMAIQKELETYRPSLNISLKKLFQSIISNKQRENLRKDKLNMELIIKRMIEFDKTKLSNSQMIELLALIDRFNQSISKYKRFLTDCSRKILHFIKQNQQKAVNFSSSNKAYVQDMKTPQQWTSFNFPQYRQNTLPNIPTPNYYQTSHLSYRHPSPSIIQYARQPTENSFYSRNIPPTTMGFYRDQKPVRGVSPAFIDTNIRQKILREPIREPAYLRQPPIMKDTGRNFYYRQASSLSRHHPTPSVGPTYPLNNLYRQFYY